MTKKVTSGITLLFAAGMMLGGCEKKPVQFAAVLPLTGDAALYGVSIKNGIELAMDEIAKDTSLKETITMSYEDSGSDPQQAASALRQAYGQAIAAIGGVTSEEALAMVPVADSAGKVLLSPTASSPELSGISQDFFRIFPSSDTEAVAMSSQLASVDTLAIVQEDDAYGEGTAGALADAYTGEVVATIKVDPATTDFGDVGQQVRDAQRQTPADKGFGVYVAAAGDSLIGIIKAIKSSGYNANLYTSSAFASPRVLDQLGSAAEGIYVTITTFDVDSDQEPMASFVAAYKAKFGETPDYYAAHGYDAAKVLVRAVKEGGAKLPSDLQTGMRAITDLPGVTGSIQFRENGDVQKFMRVHRVVGGKLVDNQEYLKNRQKEINDRRKALQEKLQKLQRQTEQLKKNS